MPIYEYRCGGCGRKIELLVMPGDNKNNTCPNCRSISLYRLISVFSYHRSETDRLADIDTSNSRDDYYYRDERNVGLRTKKRLMEMGYNPGPEFNGIIEEERKKVSEEIKG